MLTLNKICFNERLKIGITKEFGDFSDLSLITLDNILFPLESKD